MRLKDEVKPPRPEAAPGTSAARAKNPARQPEKAGGALADALSRAISRK
jgi:hypothetical protein